jgi:hypothetical protein
VSSQDEGVLPTLPKNLAAVGAEMSLLRQSMVSWLHIIVISASGVIAIFYLFKFLQ